MTPNKKLTSKLIALTCIASLILAFFACKKDGSVSISKEEQLKQTAYADENNTGSGFTFTATDNWTATVKETTIINTKGSGVSWIKLLYNDVETYSGGKGTYTMVVFLEINYTGKPRTADIEVTSGSDKITISVTQQGRTKDGEIPTLDNPVLVSRIKRYGLQPVDFVYDAQNRLSSIKYESEHIITITYPSTNTIIANDGYEEYVFTLNNDGYVVKIKRSSGFEELFEYENGYLKKGTGDGGGGANCIWENGNLKSVQLENYGETFTYSYNTNLSKLANISSWTTPMLVIGDGGEFFYHFFPSAYFGKSSKNLVSSVSRNGNLQNCRYETNTDGYVTKVYYTDYDDLSQEHIEFEIYYK
jgi:hypothetical protein